MKKVFDPKLKWFHQVNVWLDLGFQGADKEYGAKSKIHLPYKSTPFPTTSSDAVSY
jgi:hypothetical protein